MQSSTTFLDDLPYYVSAFAVKASQQPEIRDVVIDLFIDDQAIIEVIKEKDAIFDVVMNFCQYMQENIYEERVKNDDYLFVK
jgi:hypothetical protein